MKNLFFKIWFTITVISCIGFVYFGVISEYNNIFKNLYNYSITLFVLCVLIGLITLIWRD